MSEAPGAFQVPIASQMVRFGLIGALTVALDFGLMYALTKFAGVHYFVASLISFVAASSANYLLSVRFVFVNGRYKPTKEFAVFLLTTSIGLGLNQATMGILVGLLTVNYMAAKGISLILVTGWNFVSKKKLVFQD